MGAEWNKVHPKMRHIRSNSIRSALATFRTQESGGSTAEFVIWVPMFALVFALVADTAMIFGGQAQVLRVVQDTNRAMSIGRLRTVEEARDMILAGIVNIAPHASVTTTVDAGLISSTVLIPVADLTATGLVDSFTNFNVAVFAQHLAES
jgi:Flp pilus assembly protein TadG